MPAHNAEQYVAAAIESVLSQTLEDFELLVIDDASSDSTGAIVGEFSDKRVQYVRLPNRQGPSGARNLGLRAAQGKYVAFLDADDLAYRHRIARQLPTWKPPRNVLLGSGYDVVEAGGNGGCETDQTERFRLPFAG